MRLAKILRLRYDSKKQQTLRLHSVKNFTIIEKYTHLNEENNIILSDGEMN